MSNLNWLQNAVTTPTGKKWLKNSGPWADEKIKPCPYKKLERFIVRTEKKHDCLIDPRRIVGTTYGDFQGMTWKQALGEKRMSIKLGLLEQSSDYYSNPKLHKKDEEAWALYEIDGDYYPISGTHRSIVAKFRAHQEGHTSQLVWWVKHITVSEKAQRAYSDLKKLMLPGERVYDPERTSMPTSNDDLECYKIAFKFWIYTWKGRSFYRMPVEEAVAFVQTKNPLLRRFLSKCLAPYRWFFALDQ